MQSAPSTTKRTTGKPAAAVPIYLDNHATTPIDPAVFDAMLPYLRENFGNPASTHMYGVRAKHAVETARKQVAKAINADPSEIYFTAGATESNNFVIKGVFERLKDKNPHIIVSSIEHKCVLEAAKHTEHLGAELTVLKVNKEGLIEPNKLRKAIKPNTVLVSVMFANNEIGTINDIKALAEICHENGIIFHTDAAQAVGKVPIDVQALGIDVLSASGHKFYGPKGIGFVYVSRRVSHMLSPLLDGGGQEGNLRSGTLNVPGIVGIGKAAELSTENFDAAVEHYVALRNRLHSKLKSAFPDMIVNGAPIEDIRPAEIPRRLPHNLNITLPSIDPAKLATIYSVAFSSTSACSSGKPEPSYVLLAIGRTPAEAVASLRFGVGRFNTEKDIDQAVEQLVQSLK